MSDRTRAYCRPLLAIADTVGGTWPERARRALVAVVGDATIEDDNLRLLHDVHAVFDNWGLELLDIIVPFRGLLKLKDLVEELAQLDSRPCWNNGRPISTHTVAERIREFGVVPVSDQASTGYYRDQFDEAWSRYSVPKPSRGTEGETEDSRTPQRRDG